MLEYPRLQGNSRDTFIISAPGAGGLNLKDLMFTQGNAQSPDMLNMMYRNGAFSKRYGQSLVNEFESECLAATWYKEHLIIQCGASLYKYDFHTVTKIGDVGSNKGTFMTFNRLLYLLIPPTDTYDGGYYEYDGTTLKEVEPYIPDIIINRRPDGETGVDPKGTIMDQFNSLGNAWAVTYHADGTSKVYKLPYQNLDSKLPIVEVSGVETTDFTYNATKGEVTFNTAPPEGINSVRITAYKTDDDYRNNRRNILRNTLWVTFGGGNSSRLLLAGGGDSKYYYSDVYDGSYFPEKNYAQIGNTEEDITGFGLQYNVCIIFKPREIYSLTYYVQNSSNTTDEEEFGLGAFTTQLVNASMGCDAPQSIQLINNQLTWYSSVFGVCTLTSTNIQDERNVRPLSRNIERRNDLGVSGIMDQPDTKKVVSADYDYKYFLVCPNGIAYVWDYGISPYVNSGAIEEDASRLSWFKFDNFNLKQFVRADASMYFINDNKLCMIDQSFNDFGEPIKAHYMSPMLQMNVSSRYSSRTATEYLKTVRDLFIQCRGDTASIIRLKYLTEENIRGLEEEDPIVVGSKLYKNFTWMAFQWYVVNFGHVFRRRANLRKTQMAGFYFYNDELDRDLSIVSLTLHFELIKTIRG